MGLELRCKTWARYVIYLFILYFYYTYFYLQLNYMYGNWQWWGYRHTQEPQPRWQLMMTPKHLTGPHNTTLPQDQQVSSPGFVCLFYFCFFLMRMVAQIMGPDNNRCMFFFFFMLFHLTHVFFSLFYLFNEMRTSTNPLTDKEELWRSIVVWSLWTRGMLFYRIFFFLIGIFWADISLMYIGLPSC